MDGYSEALNEAAAALEPSKPAVPTPIAPPPAAAAPTEHPQTGVMSEPMSQTRVSKGRVLDFPKKIGSPHWTISATGWCVKRR